MLQARIISWSIEEVFKFYEVCELSLADFMKQNCVANCNFCKYKHICEDLTNLASFFSKEKECQKHIYIRRKNNEE